LLAALQAKLWFGSGGLPDARDLRQTVRKQRAENARLQQRNDALSAEVEDLKSGEGGGGGARAQRARHGQARRDLLSRGRAAFGRAACAGAGAGADSLPAANASAQRRRRRARRHDLGGAAGGRARQRASAAKCRSST
jgi:hypothetical protein